MSCSEHNTTGCLICIQAQSICKHGNMGRCSVCDVLVGKAADEAAKANGCGCYVCAPKASDLGRETLELARTRIQGLTDALNAVTRRASELTDELGAMRSDRDQAMSQLRSMQRAFEIQTRQLAKLQGIKTR